jgi:hypothetical protein
VPSRTAVHGTTNSLRSGKLTLLWWVSSLRWVLPTSHSGKMPTITTARECDNTGVRTKSTNASENREIEQCQALYEHYHVYHCQAPHDASHTCANVAARRSMRPTGGFLFWSATDAIATWPPHKREQKSEFSQAPPDVCVAGTEGAEPNVFPVPTLACKFTQLTWTRPTLPNR